MPKIEKKIIEFLEEHYWLIGVVIISVFACLMRYWMMPFESGDYVEYLRPWTNALRAEGGLSGIATYEGNYNMPYVVILALFTYLSTPILTATKILSIVFDFILAMSCGILVAGLVEKNKKEYYLLTYSAVLLLPTVFLNSALWGQCDSIYTAFIVLALIFLLDEKYTKSFIMLGIAFAFKLQTIFILPIYIILYFAKKKFSILNALIIPAVNIVMSIPALLNGVSFAELFKVYGEQVKTYDYRMVMNFPNMYNLLNCKPEIFYRVSTVFALGICALMLGYTIVKKIDWTKEKILTLSLWFVVVITYVLPGMHDRYMYLGEILILMILITYKKYLPLAIFAVGSTFVTYSAFLFGNSYDIMPILSLIYLAVIAYFTKDLFKLLNNEDNNLKEVGEK